MKKTKSLTKARNPFTLPSDEEVFILREQERKQKKEERKRLANLKVWQKTTSSSRLASTTRIQPADIYDGDDDIPPVAQPGIGGVTTETHHREKEDMSSFIAKKREMFLVQMSLDTKREEIRKLEEKAELKEEALRKSELMLEEDAIRFDTFLKENDKKAHEAIKRAEAETKRKQEKIQLIKKLKAQIQLVQSEVSKLKEQLDLCEEYKKFLDNLTPSEYFAKQSAIKQDRQEKRRVARWEAKVKAWEKAKVEAEKKAEADAAAVEEALAAENKIVRKKDRVKPKAEVPPPPELDEEELDSSDEDLPMYFKEPQQLLDIFTALEESNLFLIQNSQETEQALEELKQEYVETKTRMDGKTKSLEANIAELEAQIKGEQNKASSLENRTSSTTDKETQDQLLNDLHAKVRKVYTDCKMDASANPTTISMLTDLEGKLESLLSQMDEMDPEYIEQAEKQKEKERREKVRQQRLKEQQEEYEERLRRSMARAAAPVKKRTGKREMKRHTLVKKKTKKKTKDTAAEEAKRNERYFS
eukprot:g5614.t1